MALLKKHSVVGSIPLLLWFGRRDNKQHQSPRIAPPPPPPPRRFYPKNCGWSHWAPTCSSN